MTDINANALQHPCLKCEYGGVWTNNGSPCGNSCKHPDILRQKGCYYGMYHSYKHIPQRCPLKQKTKAAE